MQKQRPFYRPCAGFWRQQSLITLPALCLLALGLLLVYRSQVQTDALLRKEQQRHRVQLAVALIHQQLAVPFQDLAHLRDLGLFDRPDQPGFLPRLQRVFTEFVAREGPYHTIRWLGNDGRERVRVNGGGGPPRLVPQAELQDKSERYYFRETVYREPGAVFVSPMDLNMERGEIEYPFTPVVRFATPVFDARGERMGVLVLNYAARPLLERFREVGALFGGAPLMLVNRQGYWLSGSDPGRQWGFMLDTDERFSNDYPQAWRRIQDADSGQFNTDSGLFTYRSVYPPVRAPLKPISDHGLQWTVISRVPAEQIAAAEWHQLQRLLLAGVPLTLLLLLGGAWFALARAERLQALHRLARSERATRTIVSVSLDAIITLDGQDRILDFNPAAEEMFEYSREEVVGKPVLEVIIPEGGRSRRQRMADYLAAGRLLDKAGHRHLQGRRADDSRFPMEVLLARDEADGEPLQVLFIRDLSLLQASREHQLLADTVFVHSPQAMMVTDAENRILRVNPAFCRITGYRPEEVAGRNPSILASGRQDAAFYRRLWQALVKEGRWSGELWNRARDGRLFLERVSISAVRNEQGRIVNFVAIFNEVSPRRDRLPSGRGDSAQP